jgi:hypothetical protein
MIDILNNRKLDNRESRLNEFLRWDTLPGTAEELLDIFDRAFEAGVAAKSDADFATMRDALDRERARYEALDRARARYKAQRRTEPVAFLNVEPGTLIRIAVNEL